MGAPGEETVPEPAPPEKQRMKEKSRSARRLWVQGLREITVRISCVFV